MRYQCTNYSCGAAAVVNTMAAFGRSVNETKVRKLADTDKDGTDSDGIKKALRSLGYSASEYCIKSKREAWKVLQKALSRGSSVILAVDFWNHWVVCVGLLGNRIILIDSMPTKDNKRENGIHVLSKDDLMDRWRSSHESSENVYQVICVSKSNRKQS